MLLFLFMSVCNEIVLKTCIDTHKYIHVIGFTGRKGYLA